MPNKPLSKIEREKPALVFIHGFRGAPLGLQEVADFFPDYQVFLPEIPPFGNSRALKSYDATSYADFIIRFINKHHLKQPILIGHSMGSTITAAVAAEYPEKIHQKIILAAPISQKPARIFSLIQPAIMIFPNRLISYVSTRFLFVPKNRALFKHALKLTVLCGAKSTDRRSVNRAATFSTTHAINDFNFTKNTLIISGTTDRLIPREKTQALAQKLQAQSVFIKNSGHLINYEAPATVAQAIRKFIQT